MAIIKKRFTVKQISPILIKTSINFSFFNAHRQGRTKAVAREAVAYGASFH